MKKTKIHNDKQFRDVKIIYASKKEVEKATKKCLQKYHDVFKELAKR
jgi:hypothetical protein